LKAFLEEMGDSIVMVNQDEFIKVHVHTDHPGDIIEKFLHVVFSKGEDRQHEGST
jgi:dihydroxyacetone kinase-like predicted kinase